MRHLLLIPVTLFITVLAQAQKAEPLTLREKTDLSSEIPEGWSPRLVIGGNLSFGSSNSVIGQQDGDTKTFGVTLESSYNYKNGLNQLQNSLDYLGAATSTPALSQFVKTSDELKLASIYLRSLESYPRVGPYVRAQLRTTLFKGQDLRSEAVTYEINDSQGDVVTTVPGQTQITLTDPFNPLTTREAIGAFYTVFQEKRIKLITRLGLGAQQVVADGQLALDDDKKSSEVEVVQLESYSQAGIEGGFVLEGDWDERTSYGLVFDFLSPLATDLLPGDQRTNWELTNIETSLKLSSKLYDWLSAGYSFSLKREPQLLDETQTTHLLTLNITYSLF